MFWNVLQHLRAGIVFMQMKIPWLFQVEWRYVAIHVIMCKEDKEALVSTRVPWPHAYFAPCFLYTNILSFLITAITQDVMKHTLSACLYVCGLSVYLVRWIYKMVLDRTCFLLSWSVSALSRFLLRLRCALFRRSRIVQIIMLSHVGKYWFTWWTLSVNCKSILFRLHVFLRRDNKLCALRVLQIFCKLVSVEQFGSGTFFMTLVVT